MKIGGAALNQTPLDWQGNLTNIVSAIKLARSHKVNLLCLPELCITGYSCEDMFLSPWLADEALLQLEEIIPLTKGISLIVGLPLWFENKLYNTACLINNGEILGFQAKQNLAKEGIHYEPRWFNSWTPRRKVQITLFNNKYPFGDNIYSIGGIKVGFEICEDAWQSSRPGHLLAKQNVDLIINPSASHFALRKFGERENLVTKSSSKFNCTYLYVNQLGNESGRAIYDGDVIIAQNGKLISRANRLNYKLISLSYSELNFASHPTGKSISVSSVSENEELTRAITLGLFDYLRKSKSNGFILSLSGGADSSTCAVLVAEMIKRAIAELGKEEFSKRLNRKDILSCCTNNEIVSKLLTCVYQATSSSSNTTLKAAESLALSIGATFYSWNIDKSVQAAHATIENAIGRSLSWESDDITLQNIQARTRSPLVWMLANINNALLLTTSNRSEGSVGYATMDGDTSGSLAPIAGIDKTFLLQWLKWAEAELEYSGLKIVNSLAPTAELRPPKQTQTDEKDLMPYNILADIERMFIYFHKSPTDIHSELKKHISEKESAKHIVKFFSLWAKNQWKRERLAPSFHLDDYNVDPRTGMRFPILSGGFQTELEALKAFIH